VTAILLLGANGQVGHELRRTLPPLGTVTALDMPEIDFSKPESLRAMVRASRPDIIVNAAAYTAVDKAESDSQTAFAVNAEAPRVLAQEAQGLGAVLVHYSTDYVFDGSSAAPRSESDATAPLSVYGASKRDGEQAVAACGRHLTFRTSWVVGVHGHNFIKTMLRLAAERDSLKVVADQFGAPTSAALLAETTAAILARMKDAPVTDPRWGLYHLVPGGETTWHGLARYVVGRARDMGLALKAAPETVLPITTAEYPTPAARPANSRLDTSRLRSAFAITLPEWQAGVDAVLDRLLPEMRS
jgi:dTDP-4-dehydrorhamnose reductase